MHARSETRDFASDTSGEPSEASPAPTNERVGKYRLAFRLASGGMGTVYLARTDGARGFSQTVAIKRIHPHLADNPKFVAMFLDEARIAARIQHPNVCGVVDFGEANGSYYFAMPYLAGESLSRVIRTAHGDESWVDRFVFLAARLASDACEGLHAAHELTDDDGRPLSVVHRDVSPQNLLVGYDGVVRVLDFGVASAEQRLHSTTTGEVKGKFAYIAPEQLNGHGVDRRADVWSLGVVLWECVAGRRLFGRSNVNETVRAVLSDPVPSLREIRPDVPLGLEEIVFRALAREPDARYPTAREMGRDLHAFLLEERRSVTPADVSELMHALFPSGAEEKRKLLERARESDAHIVAPATPSMSQRTMTTERKRRSLAAIVFALLVALIAGSAATVGLMKLLEQPAEIASIQGTEAVAREPTMEASTEMVTETLLEAPIEQIDEAGDMSEERDDDEEIEAPDMREEPPDMREELPDMREERPRETAEEPREFGELSIAIPGGWGIAYDGRRRLGEVPRRYRLTAGRHTIFVQPNGRGTKIRRVVTIRAGQTHNLSVAAN
jgi:serine/threonine-protein kinase